MNELKEPLSNIDVVCAKHAPKPNPRFRKIPLQAFVGKFCKLSFLDEEGRIEHMWIECGGLAIGRRHELAGTLDNDPIIATWLEYGDRIEFDRSEIEDVFQISA